MDEIPQHYRTDAAQPHMTQEQDIFMLPPLPLITDKHKSTAKSVTYHRHCDFTIVCIFASGKGTDTTHP